MNEENKNKVVWITGSASGVGRHLANAFVEKGYRVLATDINFISLKKSFSEAARTNKNLILEKQDVTSKKDWEVVFKKVILKFKQLDILINNAGYVKPSFLIKTNEQDLNRHIDINFKGVAIGSLTAAKYMQQQKKGHIINIASLAGVAPVSGLGLYSAAKFAVRSFSLVLAHELKEHGVYVTVVCPDLIKTPMYELQLDYADESALVFSGPKPLTTKDIENVIFQKALKKKPMEITLPRSRGFLSKMGNIFPNLSYHLSKGLRKKGRKKIIEAKANQKKEIPIETNQSKTKRKHSG